MPLSSRAFTFLLAASILCHQNASAAVCDGDRTTSCDEMLNTCTASGLCVVGADETCCTIFADENKTDCEPQPVVNVTYRTDCTSDGVGTTSDPIDELVECVTEAVEAEVEFQVLIELAACLKESGVEIPEEFILELALCVAGATGDVVAVFSCITEGVSEGNIPNMEEWITCVTEANGDDIEVQVAACFVESGGDIPDIPGWVECVLNAGDDVTACFEEGDLEECVTEAGENLMKLFACFGLGDIDCDGACMAAATCFEADGCSALDKATMMWEEEYALCNLSGAILCVSCFPSCEVAGDEGPTTSPEPKTSYTPTTSPVAIDCGGPCAEALACFDAAGCAALDKDTMMWKEDSVYNACNTGAAACVSCFPECVVAGDEGPTTSPTDAPSTTTKSPTTSPVAVTDRDPTTAPTMVPTTETKSPTTSPVAVTDGDQTTTPTMAPTTAPTKSPTTSPIEDSGCGRAEVVLGWMVLALATAMFH